MYRCRNVPVGMYPSPGCNVPLSQCTSRNVPLPWSQCTAVAMYQSECTPPLVAMYCSLGVSRHVSPPLGESGYVSPAACKPGHVSPAASPVQSSGLSVETSLPSTGRAERLPPPPPSTGRAGAVRNPRPHTGH